MAPEYRLTYFAARGWAEASRLILHYAGVPFEDVRVTMDEWPKLKHSKILGHRTLSGRGYEKNF